MTTGKVAEIGNTWSGWAKILATVFAGLTLLGAGGYINSEIWQSKRLAYTIMPAEERQGHFSNGLTIENRGRITLTDVQIIIGGLGVPIEAVQLPEVHQPATVVDGGEGFDHVRIDMPRLSPDHALTVRLETSDPITLAAERHLIVTAAEAVGKPSLTSRLSMLFSPWLVLFVVSGIILLAIVLALLFFRGEREYQS